MGQLPAVWNPETQKFQCRLCDYQHLDTGAMRLHAYKKHGVGRKQQTKEVPKNTGASASGCAHTWRLLRSNDEVERRAMVAGYLSVCTACLDLRRD